MFGLLSIKLCFQDNILQKSFEQFINLGTLICHFEQTKPDKIHPTWMEMYLALSTNWEPYFYVCDIFTVWRLDHHFKWSSELCEGLAFCRAGNSLRKHPFLLALRRLGRFERRKRETSPAAKSEEKRMFLQARIKQCHFNSLNATYINSVASCRSDICNCAPSLGVKCQSVLQERILMYYTKHIAPSHMVPNLINMCNVSINLSWHNASP